MNKVLLNEVSELITKGTTPSSVGCDFTTEGINFIKSESIANSKFLNSLAYTHIDEITDEKLKRSRLKEGDLLVSIAGAYLGKIAIVRPCDVPANTNQAVGIVRLNKKKVDVDYVYYYFSQKHINSYINKLSAQSSQPNLNLDLLGKLGFDCKELAVQQKIASVLSSLDSKIELNNRINAELEVMAKTLYDYWFVQFDFPNAKGKPYKTSGGKMVWSDELKREIPEGWEVLSLRSIVKCNYDSIKNNKPDFISYLDTSNLTLNIIENIQYIDLSDDSLPSRAQRIVNRNDILYSTVRPNQRHFGIIKRTTQNMVASTGFAQLTSINSDIKNDFIYLFLSSETVVNRLDQIASSSVSAYPSISPNDILDLKVALPCDRGLIISVCEFLESIYEHISLIQQENKQLASLRDWLLPMLMNGQVKVS